MRSTISRYALCGAISIVAVGFIFGSSAMAAGKSGPEKGEQHFQPQSEQQHYQHESENHFTGGHDPGHGENSGHDHDHDHDHHHHVSEHSYH